MPWRRSGATVWLLARTFSLERHPDTEFIMVGAAVLEPLLRRGRRCALHPHRPYRRSGPEWTTSRARLTPRPLESSMWMAIDAARRRTPMSRFQQATPRADGNGQVPSADHGHWPARHRCAVADIAGESIVLDVGATIGADARASGRSAVMGSAMPGAVRSERPTVGLLNIGWRRSRALRRSVRPA